MELKVGDLVLILPPEEFGVDRNNKADYGPFWNSRPVDENDRWVNNTVNMDFYVGKVGRVTALSSFDQNPTANVALHEIYGQRGGGWLFNTVHLKKLDDESDI